MRNLAKYLKPYWLMALLCIVLVFAQAMGDLKLPDYMADIVNIGVMGGGIEDSVPLKMRGETAALLFSFMDDDTVDTVKAFYSPNEDGSLEYSAPKDLSRKEVKTQQEVLADAFTASIVKAAAVTMNVDEGVLLAQGDSVIDQIAVAALKAEYQALNMDTAALQRNSVLKTGGKMLLVALVVVLSAIGAGYLSAKVASNFSKDIRADIFAKVMALSGAEINEFSTASLITRTTNDVQQMQQVVTMLLRIVIYAPIMGFGGLYYAIKKSPSMSWIIGLAVVVLIGLMVILFIAVMPRFKQLQKLIDRINLVTRENVSGIMVSRAYNNQRFEEQRFDTANKDLSKTYLFLNRVMALTDPFMMLIMNGLSVLIIWVGSHHIANANLMIGDMMAYIQYVMHVVISFLFVSAMFIMLPRAAVSGQRINEVLSSSVAVSDPKMPKLPPLFPQNSGVVEVKNVSFAYPLAEQEALTDISFTLTPGKTTAIIGATGSGKSTLCALLMRFYDATSGTITLDGVDIKDMRQHDLREQIGYVPQKSVLFSGTIAENIRLGNEKLSNDDLEDVAKTAQAIDFVREREKGFGDFIAQGGGNVSGGQRQRLSIARALAKKAKVLIFDDSFSALDFKTDAALRKDLAQKAKDSALLIVAQRIGTIMNAHEIIVLDEGRIVGKGTHKALMETCPTYKEIALSQLREEDLA